MQGDLQRVRDEWDLGALAVLPPGTPVLVERSQRVHLSVGGTTAEIADRLGWSQPNVWLPEHAALRIPRRYPVFPDPLAAIQHILQNPVSVHDNPYAATNSIYFLGDGRELLRRELYTSTSNRYVEAIVESRQMGRLSWLRLFHLSPARRNRGGEQRWP